MSRVSVSNYLTSGVVSFFLAGPVSSQGVEADKYSFPELTEVNRIEPIGLDGGGMDIGPMSNFRRAFFVDERAFVLQLPGSGRYYLGILDMPSVFTGRCSRRPESLARIGGTYFLACGNKGMPVGKFYVMESTEQMREITDRLQE